MLRVNGIVLALRALFTIAVFTLTYSHEDGRERTVYYAVCVVSPVCDVLACKLRGSSPYSPQHCNTYIYPPSSSLSSVMLVAYIMSVSLLYVSIVYTPIPCEAKKLHHFTFAIALSKLYLL